LGFSFFLSLFFSDTAFLSTQKLRQRQPSFSISASAAEGPQEPAG
jgi:hypothetical protein